jgi:hypothetical protein
MEIEANRRQMPKIAPRGLDFLPCGGPPFGPC